LRRLQRQVDQLATDIHELSHELHSSKLQHCGLGAALRELCAQHSENHQLKVELSVEELNSALPSDVALCLFRVAQEALANAARHSLTRELIVRASCDSGKVRLQVKDFGVGFDPSVQSEGIGLASMRERLRIVGGTFVVRSSANEGTEIIAEVEVPDQAAAAG
jgi:signal transduction histidine kinase